MGPKHVSSSNASCKKGIIDRLLHRLPTLLTSNCSIQILSLLATSTLGGMCANEPSKCYENPQTLEVIQTRVTHEALRCREINGEQIPSATLASPLRTPAPEHMLLVALFFLLSCSCVTFVNIILSFSTFP